MSRDASPLASGQAPRSTVIIGAGPAGLSAAYELTGADIECTVLESDSQVGGLSKTLNYKGFLFDIGGHRFFTKVGIVEQMWRDVLQSDLLVRPRLSRIYYRGKFFDYPLQPLNVLQRLGVIETLLCAISYAKARMLPTLPEPDFETWVSNRFGRRLFDAFFRHYTEKVWGIKCSEISAEWAVQRINTLSFLTVIRNAFGMYGRDGGEVPKSLIDSFLYPREGPGMMWSRTAAIVEERGGSVILNSPVQKIDWEPGRIVGVRAGNRSYRADTFISSMPVQQLIASMSPAPGAEVLAAASQLRYRDYLAVCVVCNETGLFPDNWIYVHDPGVRVGRIQNYGNWSPDMIPNSTSSCLGMEYFCFEGDELWTMPDHELLAMSARELKQLNLVAPEKIIDGCVLRVPKAYPVYDSTYQQCLAVVREFLKTIPNLQLIGRNGMHRYNNQDHSMLTGMLAARNILGANYDLWSVNADEEYHESGVVLTQEEIRKFESSQPLVPQKLK